MSTKERTVTNIGVYQGTNYVRVMVLYSDDSVSDIKMTTDDFMERMGLK